MSLILLVNVDLRKEENNGEKGNEVSLAVYDP